MTPVYVHVTHHQSLVPHSLLWALFYPQRHGAPQLAVGWVSPTASCGAPLKHYLRHLHFFKLLFDQVQAVTDGTVDDLGHA